MYYSTKIYEHSGNQQNTNVCIHQNYEVVKNEYEKGAKFIWDIGALYGR